MMKNKVAAIILAAGKGTRMKSKDKNKVALPFLNKPLIIYAVELMLQVASPVVVVIGAFHKSVKQILNKYPLIYAYQKKRLGTGHAVKVGFQALTTIDRSPSLVLVGYGDHSMFYDKQSIIDLIKIHKKNKSSISLITTDYPCPEKLRWGFIIRDKQKKITDIIEFRDANQKQRQIKEINAGFYCFDYLFLIKNINKIKKSSISGEYYINSFINIAVATGKKVVALKVPFNKVGIGINTQEELKESEKIYLIGNNEH